jgi:TPP-dependent pyruvate/acetoin dehydrogenase alpha subunit
MTHLFNPEPRHKCLLNISHGHNAESLKRFEAHIAFLWESGELPYLIHLSGGNEEELLELSTHFRQGDWFFSSHRNHYHFLLSGGSEEQLLELIKNGKSMFVYGSHYHNFVTSSILAGCSSIAVGVAHTLKSSNSHNKVWCFLGDGAEEQGHFYESVLFAASHKLPITFIIEDNDRSVDVSKSARTNNFRLSWPENVVYRYSYRPTYPHAGSGARFQITFNEPLAKKPHFND